MFERFTKEARCVVVRAQDEARQLHHPAIGTEHLLLGLLREEQEPVARALREHGLTPDGVRRQVIDTVDDSLDPGALATLGIDLEEVRRATEAAFGPGALDPKRRRRMATGHIPLTRRAKKSLELSLREALRLHHDHIGTGHLLLGLLREGAGLAARIISDTGIDLGELREEVARLIATPAA